ncbi:hypothetical protein TNCT_20141 [Trichonephila clavata]|uniref:Uncharacterized protein n=1 Tax=Trichonephila clavata TaxID=2740835 RepID=A0A8X6HBP0_TRICU|nr:hypothetical protein TNCT_20141 [Trichonephila clavata]
MCVRIISDLSVLQFTPNLAAGCVLHRPASRVIHCSELYDATIFIASAARRTLRIEFLRLFPPPKGRGSGAVRTRAHLFEPCSEIRTSLLPQNRPGTGTPRLPSVRIQKF